MSDVKRNRNLGEAALSLLVTTDHLPLAELLTLRTISHRICDAITGHMPGKLEYKLISRPDRIQVQAANHNRDRHAMQRACI